jgi:RimJ/RimL family protein N-acetyltransferase
MTSVFLRALEVTDLERTYKWHNDIDLYTTFVNSFRFVSRASETDWLSSKTCYSNQDIDLAICLKDNSKHIGNIYVRDIDWVSRSGYLAGIFIGEPENRRQGFGEEAIKLMTNHCFFNLGLQRLWTHILEENTASLKMFEKCGFLIEGTLRRHAFKNGKFINVIVAGLLADPIPGNK